VTKLQAVGIATVWVACVSALVWGVDTLRGDPGLFPLGVDVLIIALGLIIWRGFLSPLIKSVKWWREQKKLPVAICNFGANYEPEWVEVNYDGPKAETVWEQHYKMAHDGLPCVLWEQQEVAAGRARRSWDTSFRWKGYQ